MASKPISLSTLNLELSKVYVKYWLTSTVQILAGKNR